MALSIFSRPWASSRDDQALGNGPGLLVVPAQREAKYTWDSRVRRLGKLKSPTFKFQWVIREKKKVNRIEITLPAGLPSEITELEKATRTIK